MVKNGNAFNSKNYNDWPLRKADRFSFFFYLLVKKRIYIFHHIQFSESDYSFKYNFRLKPAERKGVFLSGKWDRLRIGARQLEAVLN